MQFLLSSYITNIIFPGDRMGVFCHRLHTAEDIRGLLTIAGIFDVDCGPGHKLGVGGFG
jgi:hypothetical protein